MKAIESTGINPKLVRGTVEQGNTLDESNSVSLMWDPCHCIIPGKDITDQLCEKASSVSSIDTEPYCGLPRKDYTRTEGLESRDFK